MNLEQIDTSTTAGKARVMQLAAEGRRVAQRYLGESRFADIEKPKWDWVLLDYAIIAEPVGPDDLYVVLSGEDGTAKAVCDTIDRARVWNVNERLIVRYIRADLASEGK